MSTPTVIDTAVPGRARAPAAGDWLTTRPGLVQTPVWPFRDDFATQR